MNILLFSNTTLDPLTGSGRTRLAWSGGLRELGHHVEVLEADGLLGAARHVVNGRRARLGWNGWRWLETHDLSRFDLIEFYGSEFWPGTWRIAARRQPRPLLVAHTDGLELLAAERLAAGGDAHAAPRRPWWRDAASALLLRGERLAFSRSDGFVTGCELDRRYLLDHGIGNPARMEVVPLGLEPAYLDLPLSDDAAREPRVVFLGSWIGRKGTAALVAALTPLLRARPALRLDLLGTGTDADPRRDFPVDVHGQIAVEPRLSMQDLITRLPLAPVFFLPAEYEGFGLALAEAMACGCAAVTTPTGFGAELRDGEEALLCPFGDAAAMAAALGRLLDDTALRARIAAAGRERVQSLRWERSVRKLEQTYLRWLDGWSGARAST